MQREADDVKVAILSIGNELLLGEIVNTTQPWLSTQLTRRGYSVVAHRTVSDEAQEIAQAMRELLEHADAVIATGGLGPTSDDRTRQTVAEWVRRPLREDPSIRAEIEAFFKKRGRSAPPSVFVQALVPEGATVFPNHYGTAPGLAIPVAENAESGQGMSTQWIVLLPGPPRELQPMVTEQAAAFLAHRLPLKDEWTYRTLRTTGIGESQVQDMIEAPLQSWVTSGLQLAYCARPGEVDVRLTAHGHGALARLDEAERVIRRCLGTAIYGIDDDTLEGIVVRMLAEMRSTLAVAESCTGGRIADQVTNIPGASEVFLGGIVSYSNEAKQAWLGVQGETLSRFGAVSGETVREMAKGARQAFGATYSLAVTGIAGPSGGTPEKPVGTVHVGLGLPSGEVIAEQYLNPYRREDFKFVTVRQAMHLLRQHLLEKG